MEGCTRTEGTPNMETICYQSTVPQKPASCHTGWVYGIIREAHMKVCDKEKRCDAVMLLQRGFSRPFGKLKIEDLSARPITNLQTLSDSLRSTFVYLRSPQLVNLSPSGPTHLDHFSACIALRASSKWPVNSLPLR